MHDVRAAELGFEEVDLEQRRQVSAVPAVGLQELLVVGAFLVPVGEQRRGDVEPLAVPGLRHHVGLLADLLLRGFLRVLRVGDVEDVERAVHEGRDEEPAVVGRQADVDRERRFFGSPMSPTAVAANVPSGCWAMSQIFDVSAVAVKA